MQGDWAAIAAAIAEATGSPFRTRGSRALGGGCINMAVLLDGGDSRYLVKLNAPAHADMFAAEAAGLCELARAHALRVPLPICHGLAGDDAFLVLEYLDLHPAHGAAQERLGHGLAALHLVTRPKFGWDRDNTIGSTPQLNRSHDDWLEFWREQRLGFQLELAASNGYGGALAAKGERLSDNLGLLLGTHRPAASLLHGDLWSGNVGATPRE